MADTSENPCAEGNVGKDKEGTGEPEPKLWYAKCRVCEKETRVKIPVLVDRHSDTEKSITTEASLRAKRKVLFWRLPDELENLLKLPAFDARPITGEVFDEYCRCIFRYVSYVKKLCLNPVHEMLSAYCSCNIRKPPH